MITRILPVSGSRVGCKFKSFCTSKETDPVKKTRWSDLEDQRQFVKQLLGKLQISKPEDFEKLTKGILIENGGRGLLNKYGNSPYTLIASTIPEYNVKPWHMKVANSFWEREQNKQDFIKYLSQQEKLKDMEDWYSITKDIIVKHGGRGLLEQYEGSPAKLIMSSFPNFNWNFWKFKTLPKSTWVTILTDDSLQKTLVDHLSSELNIKSTDDWLVLTKKIMVNNIGKTIPLKFSQLLPWIKKYHSPDLDPSSFFEGKYQYGRSEMWLHKKISQIFPEAEILYQSFQNNDGLQLDVFIPGLKLALEFQGLQHYETCWLTHGALTDNSKQKTNLEYRMKLDEEKRVRAEKENITLITIPYWWDMRISSLKATLYQYRPDLFNKEPTGLPIPISKPSPQEKPKLILADHWDPLQDPTGWLMSEKYDGIRAYWTGSRLLTRNGTLISLPTEILDQMPNIPMDGELWVQHGSMASAASLMWTKNINKWRNSRFLIFDLPNDTSNFEQRIKNMDILKSKLKNFDFIQVIEQDVCTGRDHLEAKYNSVISHGGEGVMLRKPGSLYSTGRTNMLYRYKKYTDTEVLVLEVLPHGLKCLQLNDREVFVNWENKEQQIQNKNISERDVITVKFYGMNQNGTLLQPTFLAPRIDLNWSDLKINS